MARAPYAAELADALDQTIAELARQAGGAGAVTGAARGGAGPRERSTGAPAPSAAAPPPGAAPAPAPVPAAPPQQAAGATSAPSGGAYGSAAGTVPPPYPEVPYASAAPAAPPPAQAPYAPAAAPPPPDVIDGNLSAQIRRLEELRRWVRDDPAFGRLVDNMIGRQVQAAEKRQRIYTAAFSVVSLAVGWLLPVLVPATSLMRLLPH